MAHVDEQDGQRKETRIKECRRQQEKPQALSRKGDWVKRGQGSSGANAKGHEEGRHEFR
jgi:hypothetical protein